MTIGTVNESRQDQAGGTLADVLQGKVRLDPAKTAIIFEDERVSYADLQARAARVATALIAAGVPEGGRVCYLGRNTARFFDIAFGCAQANTVLVPINWRLAPAEIGYTVDDSEARILFVSREFLATAQAVLALDGLHCALVLIDGEDPGATPFEEWLRGCDGLAARPAGDDDVVFQIYTSGTTSKPKGAQLTHRNIMSALRLVTDKAFGQWTAADLLLIPLPLFHAGGAIVSLYAFHLGATLVLTRDADIARIIAAFETHPITKLGVVPALMGMLLKDPGFSRTALPTLDTVLFGGSPVSPDVLRKALSRFGCPMTQLFGMTESSVSVTGIIFARDEDDTQRLLAAGRALPGVDLRIVGPEGDVMPVGKAGEIVVRSSMVMKGYWKRPEQTADVLRDGWYHTGDVGHLDESGNLYVHDRLRDIIISGGENVYPNEVENVLAEHPDVAEVAVIGVPDLKWGEAVKAVVVARAGASPDPAALVEFARRRIAAYKCPRSFDFVEQLPRNALGKVLRRELRQPYWGTGRQVN